MLKFGRNAYLLDKAKHQVAVHNHPAAPLMKVKYTPIVHRGAIRCVHAVSRRDSRVRDRVARPGLLRYMSLFIRVLMHMMHLRPSAIRSRVLKSLDGVAIEDTSIRMFEESEGEADVETPPRKTKSGYKELV